MSEYIFLSPHLDDAVFSCGGFIAHLGTRDKGVRIITVCAGDPPPGVHSAYIDELHARWEAGKSPLAARREEDRRACAVLGADYCHLEVPDCVYRLGEDGDPLYPSEDSISGDLHPADRAMVGRLSDRFKRAFQPAEAIYVPLGFGGHVDHQLTRLAAQQTGRELHYYWDVPYAIRGGEVPGTLGWPQLEKTLVKLSDHDLILWVAGAAAYRSQLSTFWPDMDALREELTQAVANWGGIPILQPGFPIARDE